MTKLFLKILHPNALWCAIMKYHPALESSLQTISYQIFISFREGFQFYKKYPEIAQHFSQWILKARMPNTHTFKEKLQADLQLPLHRLLWLALLCFGHLCIGHIYHKNTRFDYVMNYLRNDYTRNDWWRTFGIEEKSLSGNFASGKCIPCADLQNDHKDDN